MKTIGIIGFGSFGKFLAEQLDADCDVRVYSNSQKQNAWSRELHEVARADYILLAVPLAAYASVLNQLKPLLSKHSILVDVCSVKQESVELIKKVLPTQQLVATHPLFGPQTADQLADQTIVLCPEVSAQDHVHVSQRARSRNGSGARANVLYCAHSKEHEFA